MFADVASAKRAYEIGRLRVGLVRACLVTALVAAVAMAAVGRGAVAWLALPLVAVTFAEWRGGPLARGAHRGLVAGLATLVLPASVLRPCCDAASLASGACCTMPSMCGVSGVVVGLLVALAWPRERTAHDHALVGGGVALGALSIAATRCAGLFVGEAVGLAGGLLAGIVASTAARAWMTNRAARAR